MCKAAVANDRPLLRHPRLFRRRRHQNRSTVLSRIGTLRGSEPWAGYDELTVSEVQAVLGEGDETRIKQVRAYERAHKNRAGVLEAAERERSNA